MKKILCLTIVLVITLCTSYSFIKGNNVKDLEDYLYETEEYEELDYDYADSYYTKSYDNWSDGGCSAISKLVDGHRLIGRNMDLNISNKCAYIVRTNAGEHRTIGLAYTFRDISPDYDEVQKEGISEQFYKLLPFMCDDVLNDEGLHIEINMRHAEYYPNGEDAFGCKETNPDSKSRVYLFELPRYIAENCSTVDDVKDYVKTLNVYSRNHYWNYSFLVSDAVGNSSLLEFSDSKIYWLDEDKLDNYDWLNCYNPKAIAQTNFYLNEYAWYLQDIKSGEGRFVSLQKGIDDVNSRNDMYDLIRRVQYSNFYKDYDECKNNYFDPRSENVGEISWAKYDLIMNPEFEDTYRKAQNEYTSEIRKLSREDKQKANKYWESTFTEVVDTNTKEIFVRFFENENILYLINFDETRKIETINEWK